MAWMAFWCRRWAPRHKSPRTTATLIRVRSEYNGRRGLSWTGGNGLTAIDRQFNHTGRGALSSSPAAGIDIEAEDGVVRNGLFINCEVINNVGPGMGRIGDSADITFQRCTFIGPLTIRCGTQAASAFSGLHHCPANW